MPPRADWVWMDGELIPFDDARVHVLSHTLHYGLGVFEGIRAYATHDDRLAIFRLSEHIRRLIESAKVAGLDIPYSRDELLGAVLETVRSNGTRPCYIRPLAFLGPGGMGLGSLDHPVHTLIATWEWGTYLGEEGLAEGIRATFSSFTRGPVNSLMSKAKIVGQYVGPILAKRQANAHGFDEAIFLDAEGYVAEGSGENLFVVRDGQISTTPAGGSILSGLTRDAVMRLAAERGLTVREERLTRDTLWIADEVFLTGTAAEVTPIREIDGRTIGRGGAGEVTRRLQEAFFAAVRGEDAQHADWLTYVEED